MTAQDLRFSLRQLFRHPGHTVTAVLALGLGIGLATAMFSIVYGALLRGLPVPAADRLLRVHSADPSHDDPALEVFLHDFLDFRARQRSFQGLAALLTMLNSCAPGIAVVNIDNGFGAGYYAHLITRR